MCASAVFYRVILRTRKQPPRASAARARSNPGKESDLGAAVVGHSAYLRYTKALVVRPSTTVMVLVTGKKPSF